MSCGFEDEDESIKRAIEKAHCLHILMYAAASNSGDLEDISFPAELPEVNCIFATNGFVKAWGQNPTFTGVNNYAILGSDVAVGFQNSGEVLRDTGTSMATAIAAGLAGRILDFSRQNGGKIPQSSIDMLKKQAGMAAVFSEMVTGPDERGFKCLAPWKIMNLVYKWIVDEGDEEQIRVELRKRIVGTAVRANKAR